MSIESSADRLVVDAAKRSNPDSLRVDLAKRLWDLKDKDAGAYREVLEAFVKQRPPEDRQARRYIED
jgi:formiminotetrahydrofolate cyclodeaminase